jgi:hypothetical protein
VIFDGCRASGPLTWVVMSALQGSVSMESANQSKVEGRDGAVALYHVVYRHENFEQAAQMLFTLVRNAQARFPNQRRSLFLDIEGHRNEQGGFDADMLELQTEFLVCFLGQFLSEIHCPLGDYTKTVEQSNAVPERLDVHGLAEHGPR